MKKNDDHFKPDIEGYCIGNEGFQSVAMVNAIAKKRNQKSSAMVNAIAKKRNQKSSAMVNDGFQSVAMVKKQAKDQAKDQAKKNDIYQKNK
ncbi:MAG: hypothetical protein J6P77_00840 [Acetobacter sp.]|nr:hypothetical protein [Acetobacter sp.]